MNTNTSSVTSSCTGGPAHAEQMAGKRTSCTPFTFCNYNAEDYVHPFIQEKHPKTANVPDELDPLMGYWTRCTPVLIHAGTGTGKSTFVVDHLYPYIAEHGGQLLIVSNRVALNLQYKAIMLQRYAPQVLKQFTPAGLREHQVFEGISARFCAYQGLHALMQEIIDNNASAPDFVVFDEAHYFCSDAFFADNTEGLLYRIPSVFQKAVRIYMTATPWAVQNLIAEIEQCGPVSIRDRIAAIDNALFAPLPPFPPKDFNDELIWPTRHLIAYRFPEQEHNYRIHVLPAESREDLCSILPKLIKERPEREKWLIFVESKEQGHKLAHRLGKDVADYLDANRKDGALWEEITTQSRFPKRVLVTTAVIDNGVNIHDDQLTHILLLTTDHVQLLQELGRKRMRFGETVHIWVPDLTQQQLKTLCSKNERLLRILDDYEQLTERQRYSLCRRLWFGDDTQLRHLFVMDKKGCLSVNSCAEKVIKQRQIFYRELSDAFEADRTHPFIRHVLRWLNLPEDALSNCDCHSSAAQEDLLIFLDQSADHPVSSKDEQNEFSVGFRKLRTAAFGSRQEGSRRSKPWGAQIIAGELKKLGLPYRLVVEGNTWTIRRTDQVNKQEGA